MFDSSWNSQMYQIARAERIKELEASMARMDALDPEEIESGEYAAILGELVALREERDKR